MHLETMTLELGLDFFQLTEFVEIGYRAGQANLQRGLKLPCVAYKSLDEP